MSWLENISNKLCSHPNYPFKNHIQNIADSFDEVEHKKIAYFHDIGKLSDEFQRYINRITKSKTTHAFEGAFLYFCQEGEFHSLSEAANFYAILKHHGNLPNVCEDIISSHFDYFEELKFDKSNLFSKLKSIYKNINVNNEYDEDELENFCEYFGEFKKYVNGGLNSISTYFLFKIRFSKLIFADKYEAIFHDAYRSEKPLKAQKYIDKLEKLIAEKNKENKSDLNDNRNKARIEILEKYIENKDNKRIFIIEAPTGVGKTFAALRLALEIAKNENKHTIITALPFTSIIDQTHAEYQKIFEDDILLKYHHLTDNKGYVGDTEQDQNLQKNDYIASTWAVDNVIVTTFNQLFYTVFSNTNRDLLKFWRLENSVIILDEIQSIPRVLLKDVAETLKFLSEAYNIHFVLMSATIPAIKEFFGQESYIELLNSEEYYQDNKRYTIIPKFNMDYGELKEQISRKSQTQSVLCVVNTKKLASKIYADLSEQGVQNLFLLSTNLIPKHRKRRIEEIKQKLKDGVKVVLVSTQMVEAGVDLDFDTGFREFAPFGSIIQTAGRINRNDRKKTYQDFELVVFDLIDHPNLEENKNSKTHPYHPKDMLEDKKDILFGDSFLESDILEKIRLYFKEAINRTILLGLEEHMKKLEFETVYKEFEKNFMGTIPNLVSVFIELRTGLANLFKNQKIELLRKLRETKSLEEKMAIKIKLKKLDKRLSKYVIDISKNDLRGDIKPMFDTKEFEDFTNLHVCPSHLVEKDKKYSYEQGWNGEYWDFGFY